MSDERADEAQFAALRPLTAMGAGKCVTLTPRRLPLGEGREALVEWRHAGADSWDFIVTGRPVSVDDTNGPVRQFRARLDLRRQMVEAGWRNADTDFTAWVSDALPTLVAETKRLQQQELDVVAARADVAREQGTIREFIPHLVILIAIAAFVYMFAAVHIKV